MNKNIIFSFFSVMFVNKSNLIQLFLVFPSKQMVIKFLIRKEYSSKLYFARTIVCKESIFNLFGFLVFFSAILNSLKGFFGYRDYC